MLDTKLLIVDDEERFLKTITTLLEKRECTIFTATNGAGALDILDRQKMDVVVLDVKMPGMGGVDVLQRIKAQHPIVEVIMLTGHSTTETAIEGLKLGAFDYLLKPCDIDLLITKVLEAKDKKKAREEKIYKARVDKIISHPATVFDDN